MLKSLSEEAVMLRMEALENLSLILEGVYNQEWVKALLEPGVHGLK